MALPFETMVFIAYTPGPLSAPDYEGWLRAVDNPFFNSRPGIAEYSNWKVVDSTRPLPFTHFDFLGLDGADALEPVWFDGPLDDFRREWVRKWGYASKGGQPEVSNQYGYRLDRHGAGVVESTLYVVVTAMRAPPPPTGEVEDWRLTEVLRKHWAIGPAPTGENWRLPAAPFNPLGASVFQIRSLAVRDGWRDALPAPLGTGDFAFCAEWLASPTPPAAFRPS